MASVNHEVPNPYLAMREAKIARNQKRLSKLGLLKPPPPPKKRPVPKKPQQRNTPVRRSRRISSQESHPDDKEGASLTSAGKRTRDTSEIASSDSLSVPRRTRELPPASAPAPAADSARSISLDVDFLLLGHNEDHSDGLLGEMVERPGKDYVIHKSFAKAACLEDRLRLAGESTKLSFNKYSGVQEWKVRLAHYFLRINIARPQF